MTLQQVITEKNTDKRIIALWRFTMIMDRIALILTIVGALNWGSIGLFKFDIVAWLFGGQTALISRIVYTLVALAGIWCISLLFRTREKFEALDE